MNATECMLRCAELGLDMETTMAVLRLDYSASEIGEAFNNMPRAHLDEWLGTLRLIAMPKKGKKF